MGEPPIQNPFKKLLWTRKKQKKQNSHLTVLKLWKVNYKKNSKLQSDIRRKEISFL